MTEASVISAVDGRGIATVTLNRPERYNAYDGPLIDALTAALAGLATDPAVRVVVLRGRGKHFQAGADVAWLRRAAGFTPAENLEFSRRTTEAMRGLNGLVKPTVALVHGACYGGGVGMVACCDVAIATESASFGLTEVRIGVIPAPIVPQLCAAMGVRGVRRYGITGERFDAKEAHRMGLIHEICPEGGLDEAAAPILDALLRSAPNASAMSKQLVLAEAGLELATSRVEALAAQAALVRASPEAQEGLDSFLSKRDPAWYRPA
jgi:methylglutaconyl-CoA hydratase